MDNVEYGVQVVESNWVKGLDDPGSDLGLPAWQSRPMQKTMISKSGHLKLRDVTREQFTL